MQITINTLFDLIHTALYLGAGEVLVTGVNRLKLTSVNCYAGIGENIKLTA